MNEIKVTNEAEAVRAAVREGYGKIAQSGGSCCSPTPTCGGSNADASEQLAQHIGYAADELAALPDGANLGLSCGNPTAIASLKPGEVVLDLGSGGGFDVFIAGRKVGPTGRVIGVDMTPAMLAKARANSASYRRTTGLDNVEFRLGEIEHLPVADAGVDVVISNCVINLSPDKPQVWREIARVLKPGGRVAVSDLALLQPLPKPIVEMVEALVGCIAGAVLVVETERMARDAGLADLRLNPRSEYLKSRSDWNDPLYRKIAEHLPPGTDAGDFITSLEVTASKPAEKSAAPDSRIDLTGGEPVKKRTMKRLQILGTGCANCAKLTETAERAAKALGLDYHLEKVTDLGRIKSFGVMMTPALVVDGAVKVAGRVPSLDEVKNLLS